MVEEKERIFVVPLRVPRKIPRGKRAKHAVQLIRSYMSRHMKTKKDKVWIDTGVSRVIFRRGIQKPPIKLKLKAVKFEDELVEVSLVKEKV